MTKELTCLGPAEDHDPKKHKNIIDKLFPERCRKPASFMTPSGPRCEACAEREMSAIREGSCLLAMLADEKGTPREVLLSKYVRIQ